MRREGWWTRRPGSRQGGGACSAMEGLGGSSAMARVWYKDMGREVRNKSEWSGGSSRVLEPRGEIGAKAIGVGGVDFTWRGWVPGPHSEQVQGSPWDGPGVL